MSYFRNKSDILGESALCLKDKSFFPGVAHCSYYRCYLLIQDIWYNVLGKTEGDISIAKSSQDSSHMVLIKEVENLIKNTGEPNAAFESKTFKRKFFDLKRLRTSADYKDEDFTYDMCCESISLSDDLVPLLKRIK